MKILIDFREHSSFKLAVKNAIGNRADFLVENLPLGDIIFKNNDKIFAIFERKTYDDFSSSFSTSRRRDQLDRLIKFRNQNPGVKIGYIIEENFPYRGSIPITTLNQASTNMAMRDGIIVFHTKNMNDTASKLIEILKSCSGKSGCQQYLLDGFKKSSMLTPSNWYISLLCSIPGIGNKKARAITQKYNRLPRLIMALNKRYETKICIPGIGEKLITEMYNFLFTVETKK